MSKRANTVQPKMIGVGVETVTRCRPLTRLEQGDLFVVVKRPDSHSAPSRQLTPPSGFGRALISS